MITPAVHHGIAKGGRAYWLGTPGLGLGRRVGDHPSRSTRRGRSSSVAVKVADQPSRDPVNGQQKGSTKLIKFTNLATAVTKASFRNEVLHMVANDAHDWGGIGKVRTSIRYVRLPVDAWPSVPAPPASAASAASSAAATRTRRSTGLKHYGWAAVEANKDGNAILGYVRTGEQLFPRCARARSWPHETRHPAELPGQGGRHVRRQPELRPRRLGAPVGRHVAARRSTRRTTPRIWVAQEYASTTASSNGNYDIWVARFLA